MVQETLPLIRVAEVKNNMEKLGKTNKEFKKKMDQVVALLKTNRNEAIQLANEEVLPYGMQLEIIQSMKNKGLSLSR